MRCIICDHDEWENVDEHRLIPQGMAICTHCGFVGYPDKYKTEEEAKEYYKADYRRPPTIGNAFTGQKKLHIHAAMLEDIFVEWKEKKITEPEVCDVGAAYGVLLNWIRGMVPKAKLNGTEYTLSYRRNAYHEYGIELTQDFDKTKKYDLISSFKVAEHQLDVDKRLREYVECLKPGGYMYISVPCWFDRMTNFGKDGFDLEYYYHQDHINCWTKKLFETLLKKVGLKVVKFDPWMYDDSYICVRDDSLMEETPVYEDPADIKDRLRRIKAAAEAVARGDFDSAVQIYPNFPHAWSNRYEKRRADPHKQKQHDPYEVVIKEFVEPAKAACPNSLEILRLGADVALRYEQYDQALSYIQEGLDRRPAMAGFLMMLSHCYRQMALRDQSQENRIKFLAEARNVCRYLGEVDMQSKNEAVNWIYQDNANLPMPSEIQSQ